MKKLLERTIMKRLLLLGAALLVLSLSTGPRAVSAQSGCGIKPLKPIVPIGCSDLEAECVCDDRGRNCKWKWVCVKERRRR